MNQHTLIVGCSFVKVLDQSNPWSKIKDQLDHDKFCIVGRAGIGNTGIAAQVLYQCSQRKFNRVIVIWSGINRIDMPIGLPLHQTFAQLSLKDQVFDYATPIDQVVWYHSRGRFPDENPKLYPASIRKQIKDQYLGANSRYLTNLTLQNLIFVQSFLTAQEIDYQMYWMYDLHNETFNERLEPSCGKVDQSSPYYDLVNWNKIDKNYAYEWCRDRSMLASDNFHWSEQGALAWFRDVANLDLKKP